MPISDEYRKGFMDAVDGAKICVDQWRYWNLRDEGKTSKAIMESISKMTPELHREYMEKQK